MRRAGHVLGLADAAARIRAPDRVAEAVERRLHHLALEGAGRDRVHGHARRQLAREHARQVVERRLARRVRVGLEQRHVQAVDRADVDDARGVRRRARALELRQQIAREEEDRLQVELEHLVPARLRILLERRAPVRAGVVHEDVRASAPARRARPRRASDPRASRGRRGARCIRLRARAPSRSPRTPRPCATTRTCARRSRRARARSCARSRASRRSPAPPCPRPRTGSS